MQLPFLGTGTSVGVPQLGCTCEVCTSRDSRDFRLRTSALLDAPDGSRLLIDCGPDFRLQMLRQDFRPLSGVLLTHEHYDHVGGLDDLRPFCVPAPVDIYASPTCCEHVYQRMAYCFGSRHYPGSPRMALHSVPLYAPAGTTFRAGTFCVEPVTVEHGALPILGYRIGDLGYITDMKSIRPSEALKLRGVSTLVVNALRLTPHATHQTIGEAIAFARQVGAARTYLTHLSHQAGLAERLEAELPPGIHAAYDGLRITV